MSFYLVNDGDYLHAVSEQSLAENVTRVLYPNDNVRFRFDNLNFLKISFFFYLVYARQRTSS
jgi:glucan phosphorylase